MLDELRKADFGRCGALQKISSSALESFDVMCWGCAGVIGGVLLTRGKDVEQCLLCSPLGFGRGVGEQSATGVCFRAQTVFRAGSAVVICFYRLDGQEMSCSLSGEEAKWNAHEDWSERVGFVDSL